MEVQLRTKAMDDNAEIGPANHLGYEKRQENERARRDVIPVGECRCFDEAYERGMRRQEIIVFQHVHNLGQKCTMQQIHLIMTFLRLLFQIAAVFLQYPKNRIPRI